MKLGFTTTSTHQPPYSSFCIRYKEINLFQWDSKIIDNIIIGNTVGNKFSLLVVTSFQSFSFLHLKSDVHEGILWNKNVLLSLVYSKEKNMYHIFSFVK